jgi:hypothetical protein
MNIFMSFSIMQLYASSLSPRILEGGTTPAESSMKASQKNTIIRIILFYIDSYIYFIPNNYIYNYTFNPLLSYAESLFIHNILSTKQRYMAKCVCVRVCLHILLSEKNDTLFCTKQSKTNCKLKIINFLQVRNNLQLNNKVNE